MITKQEPQVNAETTLEMEAEKLSKRIDKMEELYLTLGGVLNTKVTPKMRFRKGVG